jgi:hypothetical protein
VLSMLRQWIWNRRRLIFRFNDGAKVVAVDPIAIAIAIHEHPKYLPRHLNEAADGDREAQAIVADAACDVFKVSRFDGYKSGLTVAERIELMMAFDVYLHVLKKNIASSQIPPINMASTSHCSSASTTSVTSDCGSTGNAPSCDPPISNDSESTPVTAN